MAEHTCAVVGKENCWRCQEIAEDERAEAPRPSLPDDTLARIDVTAKGVRVNLREGMPGKDFAEMLRMIADSFDDDTMKRVE